MSESCIAMHRSSCLPVNIEFGMSGRVLGCWGVGVLGLRISVALCITVELSSIRDSCLAECGLGCFCHHAIRR